MEYKKFRWALKFNPAEDRFDGTVMGASQPLTFHGRSVDELKANFESAVDRHLAKCAAKDLSPYRKYSGKMILRFPPEVHQDAFMAAVRDGKSLTQWIEEAILERLSRTGRK